MACRLGSKNNPQFVSFVVDNMASKMLPKRRRETTDAWSRDKLIVHLGGVYDDKTDSAYYYIYPETVSEDTNTILTQCHKALLRHIEKSKLQDVVFIFDNHSTQKNYYVLGYLEYLVQSHIIPLSGSITAIFLVRGHTHNRLDMMNSKVSRNYHRAHELNSLLDLVNIVNTTGHRFRGELLFPFYDFKTWLQPHIKRSVTAIFNLATLHQVQFTKEGAVTKEFNEDNWSSWRGRSPSTGASREPFRLLQTLPTGRPQIVEVPELSAARMLQLAPLFGGAERLTRVMAQYVTPAQLALPLLPSTLEPTPDSSSLVSTSGSSSSNSASDSCGDDATQERAVYDVVKRRFNKSTGEYEWLVKWADKDNNWTGERSWEPKASFIDSDDVVNDVWAKYEETHRYRKISTVPDNANKTKHVGTKRRKRQGEESSKQRKKE